MIESVPPPSAEQLDALRIKHTRIFTIRRGDYHFVLRRAETMAYREAMMLIAEDKANSFDANEKLALHGIVYPDAETLKAVLADWPGLVPDLGGEVALVSGLAAKAEAKKA